LIHRYLRMLDLSNKTDERQKIITDLRHKPE
jgi:hypothetical protein